MGSGWKLEQRRRPGGRQELPSVPNMPGKDTLPKMGKVMPGVFSLPPGPGLGHQLLPALLPHLHPVLWHPGIPGSPHVCQVGAQGHPCCSAVPPVLFEPGLSSAVSHCFTSPPGIPAALPIPAPLALDMFSCLHLPLPRNGPARILLPFLIPCSHTLLIPLWSWLDPPRVPHPTLFPGDCGGNSVQAPSLKSSWKTYHNQPIIPKICDETESARKKKPNCQIRSSALAENKPGIRMIPGNSLSTSIQVSAAPCKPHSSYPMSPSPVETVTIFPGFAGFWRVTGSCGSPR